MAIRDTIKELYRRLEVAARAGYIERQSFDVGMQLLNIMVQGGSCDFVFTWQDLVRSPVMQAGRLLADAAPATHFEFYGALQQLEHHLGLVTHVSREELTKHVQAGRVAGEYHNFTGMPGVDSYIINGTTLVLCVYESWVGDDLDECVAEYVQKFESLACLPKWLKTGAA